MILCLRRCALLAAFAALCLAQAPTETTIPEAKPSREPPEVPLPGKPQRERILEADMAQNRKEAARLVELAQQLSGDLEKNSKYVFSLADLKKAEEIERLARKIRTRMQHN
jgi:hypothetical protein